VGPYRKSRVTTVATPVEARITPVTLASPPIGVALIGVALIGVALIASTEVSGRFLVHWGADL